MWGEGVHHLVATGHVIVEVLEDEKVRDAGLRVKDNDKVIGAIAIVGCL